MNDLFPIALGDIDLGIIEDIDLGDLFRDIDSSWTLPELDLFDLGDIFDPIDLSDLFADFALGDLSADFSLMYLDDLTKEWASFKFPFDFPDLGGGAVKSLGGAKP